MVLLLLLLAVVSVVLLVHFKDVPTPELLILELSLQGALMVLNHALRLLSLLLPQGSSPGLLSLLLLLHALLQHLTRHGVLLAQVVLHLVNDLAWAVALPSELLGDVDAQIFELFVGQPLGCLFQQHVLHLHRVSRQIAELKVDKTAC